MIDSAVIIAICGTVSVLATQFANLIVSLRNSDKVERANYKQDALLKKTDEIHDLTNGNNDKLNSQLETANQKLEHANQKIDDLHTIVAVQQAVSLTTQPFNNEDKK